MEHATIASLIMTSTEILKDFNSINKNDKKIIKQHLNELDGIVGYLSLALNKVSNISNICKNKLIMNDYENSKRTIDNTNVHDLSELKLPLSITNNTTKKIAPGIECPVQIVDELSEIPNMYMYWVKNLNQYAFKINNITFRGNIGNIYQTKTVKANQMANRIVICNHGNLCKTLLNGNLCKYYHDPLNLRQLLTNGIIDKKLYKKYIHTYRNFSNASWIYTDMPQSKNNIYMRHFGSRNTLKYEIDMLSLNTTQKNINNIKTFHHQCMHDILVAICLSQHEILRHSAFKYSNK